MSLKAFDLIPVVEHLDVRVACFEACGNELYLGTDDGQVLRCSVGERTDPDTDETCYTTKHVAKVYLSSKYSVTCLGAASSTGRLLALVDGLMHLLDHKTLETVSTASKNKGVSTFCLNYNPSNPDPFALEMCVGRRRCVQLLVVQEDRVSVVSEVSCPDPPTAVSLDGVWACVASQGQYCLYNFTSGDCTHLFPYDASTTPIIRRIMKEEFLLSGPSCLGMFVSCDGVSIRPPISWSEDVLAVAYHHPYVLTVTPQFIRIYSVVDQQVKQTVRFSGGRLVGNFDGQVYVGTVSSIYCLMPQPWYKQVQVLLSEERVEEAVELCEQHGGPQHEQLVRMVLQRAGFLRLLQEQYNAVADYFLRGHLDPRELMHIFPGLLPASSDFVRSVPPLHHIVTMETECSSSSGGGGGSAGVGRGGGKDRLQRATNFVLEYLLACRATTDARQHAAEVNTGIVKLLCRLGRREELLSFLDDACKSGVRLQCDVAECAADLQAAHLYLALHKLHSACGDAGAAGDLLVQLTRGQLQDPLYPGPCYFRDFLLTTGSKDLVMRYCPVLLEVDPGIAVTLFTGHRDQQQVVQFDPQHVLSVLANFPSARIAYLHHLVDDLQLTDSDYHTELVLHYADGAVRLAQTPCHRASSPALTNGTSEDALQEARAALLNVLETCRHYDAAAVLSRIRHCKLLQTEKAMLLGRMGDHEKALRLLVNELHDYRAAEEYCASQLQQHSLLGGTTPPPPLYLLMLKAYLQPRPGGGKVPDTEVSAPLSLLRHHASDLPLPAVLPLLPSHWTLAITRSYTRTALAQLHHHKRKAILQKGAAKCALQQQTALLAQLCASAGPVRLDANSICMVCCERLSSPSCGVVVYSSGVVAHSRCVPDLQVCPLTGTCASNTHTHHN
ncbi:Citron (CNH) domain [Trinorchestia longiramus]|nr:Citron (CNH) domain [Trinorchestia longiramus]